MVLWNLGFYIPQEPYFLPPAPGLPAIVGLPAADEPMPALEDWETTLDNELDDIELFCRVGTGEKQKLIKEILKINPNAIVAGSKAYLKENKHKLIMDEGYLNEDKVMLFGVIIE